jgi:enoyl-CoA hydratase
MAYELITYEVEDGIALVTLNRPQVLNALNRQVIGELGRVMQEIREDDAVRVVILTGAGEKAFAAGADISELAELDPLGAVAITERGQALTRAMERLGKPIIAALNGFALGGGCELAMACTLRIAADTAKLGQPEVNLGVLPGYGGTQRLARLVGAGRALDLTLTGRMIPAAEAMDMGLVNRVVPAAELMDTARKTARSLAEKSPLSVRLILEAVHRGQDMGLDDALAWESHLFGLCASSEDMKEGLRAFLEKRKPEFKGR